MSRFPLESVFGFLKIFLIDYYMYIFSFQSTPFWGTERVLRFSLSWLFFEGLYGGVVKMELMMMMMKV